jgi:hypothetical protein
MKTIPATFDQLGAGSAGMIEISDEVLEALAGGADEDGQTATASEVDLPGSTSSAPLFKTTTSGGAPGMPVIPVPVPFSFVPLEHHSAKVSKVKVSPVKKGQAHKKVKIVDVTRVEQERY